MARARNKLTARKVATLAEPGRHSDGGSLYLAIDGSGAAMRRRWLFLFNCRGKRREMGLGGFPEVSLADARAQRDLAEQAVRAGRDPIEERAAARQAEAGKPTFGQIADALIEAKGPEWRNDKHRAQWKMTLEVYAAPLRTRPVDEIDTEAVLGILQPIWQTKPETASRLRGRIEAVLDAARAKGHIPRNEANPARWRGHLDKLLPKRTKLSRGHHAAMDYADVPGFIAELRGRDATAALCLEFTILTACRSGETLNALWSEIDIDKKLWMIPAARMKAAREHRVPLSDRALAILENLATAKTGEFVFGGQKAGKPLSGMAMEMVLRRMKVDDVTVHGFRSAFRDWAGNETHFPRELAEAALAHVIGDKAEQAYRRGDALEKRRALMEAWANYCEPTTTINVIPIKRNEI
ncbi:integrase arm-type DNA-binding domain-containing protein [Rhodoblastus sp. 17X3]|uniref:tyrosine-type recombinase/integrase n=1 Tax=Rhodoblastus sp. 17X3 TaxID=3047026 RepID=UPI0024B71196|nr:site-specific integrase [Rhodoblastus sp. 17X3]MDI9848651.1 integrase arm-type DNA-binding domain-containing protein [Rhodoblastus sp. 17X3]